MKIPDELRCWQARVFLPLLALFFLIAIPAVIITEVL